MIMCCGFDLVTYVWRPLVIEERGGRRESRAGAIAPFSLCQL